MMGKVSGEAGKRAARFSSKAVLVVTIVPLWALWIYAYANLRSLQGEVDALPRFYGMYLYKEHVRARLQEAARQVSLFKKQSVDGIEAGTAEAVTEEERRDLDLLFGPGESLVVVVRKGLRILYPSGPPYGSADFLDEPEARAAFLRTLRRIDRKGSPGGYFSIKTSDASGASVTRGWFLAVAKAGEDLLCIVPVPEERIRRSGGILEEAQQNLLQASRRRFVRLTLPVVVLNTVLIGILYRKQGKGHQGRGT
jgi:hypothetical protein